MVVFKGQLSMKQYIPLEPIKRALKSGNVLIHRTAMFVIFKFIQGGEMVVSQSTDLAIALCKNLLNHLLEKITTYSVTIFLLL